MTKRTLNDDGVLVPATRGVPDETATRGWAEGLVARARAEGVELTGDGGLLTGRVREVLQTGLEVELAVPHDRDGTFDPVTVPKHARRFDGLTANVISLAAPSAGAALSGRVDRRDRDQGPRQPGREPAGVCGDRGEPRRRTRGTRTVARPDRWGRRETVDDDARRTQEPWCRRRADRLLRRFERLAGRDRVTWLDATVQTCVVHRFPLELRKIVYTTNGDREPQRTVQKRRQSPPESALVACRRAPSTRIAEFRVASRRVSNGGQ